MAVEPGLSKLAQGCSSITSSAAGQTHGNVPSRDRCGGCDGAGSGAQHMGHRMLVKPGACCCCWRHLCLSASSLRNCTMGDMSLLSIDN